MTQFRLRPGTTLIAGTLLLALTACVSTAGGSSSGSGGSSGGSGGGTSGGSGGGVQQPAPKHGSCTVVHPTIANLGGMVTATVDWSCEGTVVMVLKLRLAFDGNNASRDDLGVQEGDPTTVNYPLDTPPARVVAPCTTSGYWRVNMVGTVDDLGSTIVLKSGTVPFNTDLWMVPQYVQC